MRIILTLPFVLAGCSYIPGTDASREAQAKVEVGKLLRDAESARFRDLRVFPVRVNGKDDHAVCGLVNGKNAHGAYAGFVRFVSLAGGDGTMLDPNLKITEAAVDRALNDCKREVADMKRNGIPDLARFQCDLAKDAAEEYGQQTAFNELTSLLCKANGAIDLPKQGQVAE